MSRGLGDVYKRQEIKNSTNPIVKAFINGTELKEEEKDEQQ